MKTKEILEKYKTIISGLLKCNKEDIHFFSEQTISYEKGDRKELIEIGELYYYKPDIEGYTKETNTANWNLGNYVVKYKEKIISTWKLYEMPHCCAYIISCKSEVMNDFRNKKIGTVLNQLRQDIGRVLGYTTMLCTDIEKNIYQRQLLKTNGWKDIHTIVNKRTKNIVHLSVINL